MITDEMIDQYIQSQVQDISDEERARRWQGADHRPYVRRVLENIQAAAAGYSREEHAKCVRELLAMRDARELAFETGAPLPELSKLLGDA